MIEYDYWHRVSEQERIEAEEARARREAQRITEAGRASAKDIREKSERVWNLFFSLYFAYALPIVGAATSNVFFGTKVPLKPFFIPVFNWLICIFHMSASDGRGMLVSIIALSIAGLIGWSVPTRTPIM